MKTACKIRIIYAVLAAILIALGLLSRRVGFIPNFVGDTLWAMTVYCCWRIILPNRSRWVSAAAALITAYAVEFSQLLSPDWLVKVRSTFIGHMLLGQGFLWTDLIAYTAGVGVIYILTELVGKRAFDVTSGESSGAKD